MGIRLIVEVFDHAPADLTAEELVVLLVIAENANDTTRQGWPGLDLIARRARVHPDSVRRVLARLARRVPPIEVRVPITTGSDGRPVYSARGHLTVYRLPRFRPEGASLGRAYRGQKGASPGRAKEAERRDVGDEKGATLATRKARHSDAPISSRTLIEPSSAHPRSRAHQRIAQLGADDDETKLIIEKIRTEHDVANVDAWTQTLERNGDLARVIGDLLGKVRTERARQRVREWLAWCGQQPPCEDGEPGGAELRPDTGLPHCPLCRGRLRSTTVRGQP